MNKTLELLNLFNRPGGRYTYYPFHAKWNNLLTKKDWISLIQRENPEKIDLYIHIPFCHSLCTFCGCNIKVMKSNCDNEMYIETIKREWKQYNLSTQIDTLYLGGGTPNFLSPNEIKELIDHFNYTTNPLITIEIDPRFIKKEELLQYKQIGINQLSFGVQDFNQDVLNNVNRSSNSEEMIELINYAYDLGFDHINLDFIYGLTFQTEETLTKTFQLLNKIKTHSLSLYPFARVPWQNNSQKAFGEIKDFSLSEMNSMFVKSAEIINQNGFHYIGMGFFSKIEKWNGRNIMGFNKRTNPYLIGLGVSAISSTPFGHLQNDKIYIKYIQGTKEDNPVIFKSHKKDSNENLREDLYRRIVLNNNFLKSDIELFLNSNQKDTIDALLASEIILQSKETYTISNIGKFFHKTILQAFDPNI